MERHEVIRIRIGDLDNPKSRCALNHLGEIDMEAFELAEAGCWEEFLKRVDVAPESCVLIGNNDGDVDTVIGTIYEWHEAIDELRSWMDQLPSGGDYEIFWKFHRGSVRKYSRDF